jgi:hypothetical protein
LSSWIGKLLSYGDMLVLINSVRTSLPMFLLSFFEIPVGVRKRDFFRSRSFGKVMGTKKIDSPNGLSFADLRTKGD